MAEHGDLTLVGDRLASEKTHRRRLARAVRSEKAEADARRHVEVQPIDRLDLSERLANAPHLDHVHGQPNLPMAADSVGSMVVAIAGGHGKIGLLLTRRLAERGD